MRTDDSSYVITTEVDLEFEERERALDPVGVRTVAIPDGTWFERHAIQTEDAILPTKVRWQGRELDLFWPDHHDQNQWDKLVFEYVHEVLNALPGVKEYDAITIMSAMMGNVRVPTFGSPPSGWQTLGDFLWKTSGVTGATVAVGVGAEPSLTLILTGVGITLFVNIVVPVTRAIGRGLEHRIDVHFGTPREPPPEAGQVTAPTPTT